MKKIYLLVFAVTAVVSGCGTVNPSALSKGIQAFTLTDAQVEQMVGDYVRQLDAQNSVVGSNDPYAVRLNRIAGAINGKDGINIKVYKTPDVNAFAVADGNVRVYSGLMDIMSDEEVLGVIGHEIGHVKLSHTRKAFQAALMTSAFRDHLSSQDNVVGTLSQSMVGDIGEKLSSTMYSQKEEREADDYGYDFLKANGLNPLAMALSFKKLKQMEEQAGGVATGPIMQLFSTHPDLDSRIERMTARAAKDGYLQGAGSLPTTTPSSTGSGKWSF
jgi:putative metalloprotease